SLVKDDPSFYNRLYHNNHDGTFTDVTEHAGLAGRGYSMGAAAADFDNDGWTDLYVTGFNHNFLYHNNGDGTFADVTERAGVGGRDASGKKLWSTGAAWLDYDNDGRLDLFVANYLDWSFANERLCGEPGKRLSCSPAYFPGQQNFLYHNNGDGTFTEVSTAAGIAQHIGKGMSVAIADYDGDGFTDIFVANDNERNFLFHNEQGHGFVEVGVESAVAFTEDGVPVSGMGADFRDLDNDGRPDLVVTALEGESFPVYLNQGRGFFMPASYQTGIGFPSRRMSGWGVGAYDFNNDGRKDIFVANSHVSENVGLYGKYQYWQPNAVFLNVGDANFRNTTSQAGESMRIATAHRGTAFGDLNNDGKVDAVVSSIGSPAEILYNTSAGGHWILIQTVGRHSNRDGIGTRIKVTGQSGLVQYNHVSTAAGYASSSDKRVHFGLGAENRIREIELRWPGGKVQVLNDISTDQILKVAEP
ncbi:MAG TPA: CRTAC1 family protein, partial [Bryobacteraceae bacterium]|nr:CRTAC1 family protein [Bryobacteraceae bacterium]